MTDHDQIEHPPDSPNHAGGKIVLTVGSEEQGESCGADSCRKGLPQQTGGLWTYGHGAQHHHAAMQRAIEDKG